MQIRGTITLADGSTSEFTTEPDLGWQQWGADQRRLGRTVDVLEAISATVAEFEEENEDEDAA
jgi:sensor domain CHASE-containing protein